MDCHLDNKIMNRTLVSLFALLVIGIAGLQVPLAAQAEQGKPVPVTPMGRTISGQRIPFRPGDSSISDHLRLVVRDREMWAEVWKRIYRFGPNWPNPQMPPLPEIDFSREMVIVAAMGRRPSSGYAIIIDGAYAYERNYRLEVVVRSVENRNCGGFAIMTAPVDIVRLSKTDRTVIFRETEVVPECQ
jgi:hypothetical protein